MVPKCKQGLTDLNPESFARCCLRLRNPGHSEGCCAFWLRVLCALHFLAVHSPPRCLSDLMGEQTPSPGQVSYRQYHLQRLQC